MDVLHSSTLWGEDLNTTMCVLFFGEPVQCVVDNNDNLVVTLEIWLYVVSVVEICPGKVHAS